MWTTMWMPVRQVHMVCNCYKTVTKRLQTLQKLQNADPALHFGRGRYLEMLMASGDLAMRLAVAAPAVGNIANTGGVGAGDRTLGFEQLPRVLGWYPEAHPRLKSCPISPSIQGHARLRRAGSLALRAGHPAKTINHVEYPHNMFKFHTWAANRPPTCCNAPPLASRKPPPR